MTRAQFAPERESQPSPPEHGIGVGAKARRHPSDDRGPFASGSKRVRDTDRALRTSIEVVVEVEIARPRDAVWSFITDIERIPEWVGEFEEAHEESNGPTGVGTVVHYTVVRGRSGTWDTVEWDPPHRVAWDGPALPWAGGGARPRGSHTLTEIGEVRTLLVSRYEPELIGTLVLMRPYLSWWLRRQRHRDAQTLKAALEAEAGS